MKSRAKNPGLLGRLVLGGAVATLPFLSGCVSNADNLYRSGQINAQQHAQMKAAENQRDEGLIFTALGTLMGLNGIRTNNIERAFVGESMRNYGIAQASADNTNVVVNNNLGNPQNSSTPYIPQVEYRMPDWKVAALVEDKPLVLRTRNDVAGDITAAVSNYFIDINKNGQPNYPEEFTGLRTVYLPDEDVTLTVFSDKPSELTLKIYDNSGKVVESDSSSGKPLSRKFRGREGVYRAEFECNGKIAGNLAFEINPNKLRFEKR